MGSCFSSPEKEPKGQRLGSGPNTPAGSGTLGGGSGGAPGGAKTTKAQAQPVPARTLGGNNSTEDPRQAALAAAEARAQASASKGVSPSNPKSGQLSAKLAAERRQPSSSAQGNERMMDAGQWN